MEILVLALILFCFFGTNVVSADPSCMRCNEGNKLVCIGSPASTVLAKCGSPLSIVEIGSKTRERSSGTFTEGVTTQGNSVYRTRQHKSSTTMKLEEWTYCIKGPYGSDCYIYILKFKGDKLANITSTLEKGN